MRARRSQTGSQIAEFGPALGILLSLFLIILTVFPFVVAYVMGLYFNFVEVREAAVSATVDGSTAQITNMPDLRNIMKATDDEINGSNLMKAMNMSVQRMQDPFALPGYDGTMRMIVVPSDFTWNSGLPFWGTKVLHYEGKRPVEHVL